MFPEIIWMVELGFAALAALSSGAAVLFPSRQATVLLVAHELKLIGHFQMFARSGWSHEAGDVGQSNAS